MVHVSKFFLCGTDACESARRVAHTNPAKHVRGHRTVSVVPVHLLMDRARVRRSLLLFEQVHDYEALLSSLQINVQYVRMKTLSVLARLEMRRKGRLNRFDRIIDH